jgi:hypothetical protein
MTPAFDAAAIAELSAALKEPPTASSAVALPIRPLVWISLTVQLIPEITVDTRMEVSTLVLFDEVWNGDRTYANSIRNRQGP